MKRVVSILALVAILFAARSASTESFRGYAHLCSSTGQVCLSELPSLTTHGANGIYFSGTTTATNTNTVTDTNTNTVTDTNTATNTLTATGTMTTSHTATWTGTGVGTSTGSQTTQTSTSTVTVTFPTTQSHTYTTADTATATNANTYLQEGATRFADPTTTTTGSVTAIVTGTVTQGSIVGTGTATVSLTGTQTVSATSAQTGTYTETYSKTATGTGTYTLYDSFASTETRTMTLNKIVPGWTQTLTGTGTGSGTLTDTLTAGDTYTQTSTSTSTRTATSTSTHTTTSTATVTSTATDTDLRRETTILVDPTALTIAPTTMEFLTFNYSTDLTVHGGFDPAPYNDTGSSDYVSMYPTVGSPVNMFQGDTPAIHIIDRDIFEAYPYPTTKARYIRNGPGRIRMWAKTTGAATVTFAFGTCTTVATITGVGISSVAFTVTGSSYAEYIGSFTIPTDGVTVPPNTSFCTTITASVTSGTPTVTIAMGDGGHWTSIELPVQQNP